MGRIHNERRLHIMMKKRSGLMSMLLAFAMALITMPMMTAEAVAAASRMMITAADLPVATAQQSHPTHFSSSATRMYTVVPH